MAKADKVRQEVLGEKPKCTEKWYKKLFKTLFYDAETRTLLSRPALMNFIFFIMAVSLFVVGVILAFKGKAVPPALYGYVGGLTGGGFLQYTFGKKLNRDLPPKSVNHKKKE